MVGRDDFSDHVESDSQSAVVTCRRRTLESLEDSSRHHRIDTWATIAHLEHEVRRVLRETYLDRLPGSVLHRVRQEVRDHLRHVNAIPTASELRRGVKHDLAAG